MKIMEDIKPISFLKARTAYLFKKINKERRPLIVTQNGEPCAVIQDPLSYNNMVDALGLMKLIAEGEKNIQTKKIIDHDVLFEKINKKLLKQKKIKK